MWLKPPSRNYCLPNGFWTFMGFLGDLAFSPAIAPGNPLFPSAVVLPRLIPAGAGWEFVRLVSGWAVLERAQQAPRSATTEAASVYRELLPRLRRGEVWFPPSFSLLVERSATSEDGSLARRTSGAPGQGSGS